MMNVRRLSLTDLKCALLKGARERTLKKALEKDGIMQKWNESSWGEKLTQKAARAEMTDFDRFKLML